MCVSELNYSTSRLFHVFSFHRSSGWPRQHLSWDLHKKRGTPIRTSGWVMNLNPFWSMSANTSRKVNTLITCSVIQLKDVKRHQRGVLAGRSHCASMWNLLGMVVLVCTLESWTLDSFNDFTAQLWCQTCKWEPTHSNCFIYETMMYISIKIKPTLSFTDNHIHWS